MYDGPLVTDTTKPMVLEVLRISDDVLIDYSKDGHVIGVEILTASRNAILPLSKTIPVELSSATA